MDNDNVINMHTTNAFSRNRTDSERSKNNKRTVSKEKLQKVVALKQPGANIIPLPGVEIKVWVKGNVYIQKILSQANLTPDQRAKVMNRIAFHTPTCTAWNERYCDGLPLVIVATINNFIFLEIYPTLFNLKD